MASDDPLLFDFPVEWVCPGCDTVQKSDYQLPKCPNPKCGYRAVVQPDIHHKDSSPSFDDEKKCGDTQSSVVDADYFIQKKEEMERVWADPEKLRTKRREYFKKVQKKKSRFVHCMRCHF